MEERVRDVIPTDRKVVVFTAFTDGLNKHKVVSERRNASRSRVQTTPSSACRPWTDSRTTLRSV